MPQAAWRLVMLAYDQHHDRHADRHAESEEIAEQMPLGYGATHHYSDANSAIRLAASVVQASVTPSHSQPRPAVRKGAVAKITATSATDV